MSQDTATTPHKANKSKLLLLGMASAGLIGGAVAQFGGGVVSATTGQDNHGGNGGWHTYSQGVDGSLVVDAVESYYAKQSQTPSTGGTATTPAVDVNLMRVTKLEIAGDNAVGSIDLGTTTTPTPGTDKTTTPTPSTNNPIFFAHKTDGVWQVLFVGPSTPPQSVTKQYNVPSEWLSPNFKF